MKHTDRDILLATQVHIDADMHACLTEVIKPIAIYPPTIAQAIDAYTRQQMGAETYDAVTKLIDPFDLYLYPALADSERQMIALIESRRPQKAGAA